MADSSEILFPFEFPANKSLDSISRVVIHPKFISLRETSVRVEKHNFWRENKINLLNIVWRFGCGKFSLHLGFVAGVEEFRIDSSRFPDEGTFKRDFLGRIQNIPACLPCVP